MSLPHFLEGEQGPEGLVAERRVVWGHLCPHMLSLQLQGAALGGPGLGPSCPPALPAYLGQVPPGRQPWIGVAPPGPAGRGSASTSWVGAG